MEEILHQLICSLSHYSHGFFKFFTSQVASRISEPSTVDGVFWMSPDLETDIFFEDILADEPGDNDPGEPLIEI